MGFGDDDLAKYTDIRCYKSIVALVLRIIGKGEQSKRCFSSHDSKIISIGLFL
jgi:hypothetical protein